MQTISEETAWKKPSKHVDDNDDVVVVVDDDDTFYGYMLYIK